MTFDDDFRALKILCQAALDRGHYLFTTHTDPHPSIEICDPWGVIGTWVFSIAGDVLSFQSRSVDTSCLLYLAQCLDALAPLVGEAELMVVDDTWNLSLACPHELLPETVAQFIFWCTFVDEVVDWAMRSMSEQSAEAADVVAEEWRRSHFPLDGGPWNEEWLAKHPHVEVSRSAPHENIPR